MHRQLRSRPLTSPGTSPWPPLSPERIEKARTQFGHSVDQYLEYLQKGDPLADDLIACFNRMPRGHGSRMLHQAIVGGIDSVDDPPPELVALFRQLDHIPFWVDWDRMYLASAKILRNGWLSALSLATYAIPHTYLATGNRPLMLTGSLLHSTAHRYALSARFVTEAFLPGNLRREADGFRFAVMVRIMHARARQAIMQSGQWSSNNLELPLNQTHMAMGILFFSYYVIQGMRMLGARVTDRELSSVQLTWRYVAHLFGINPEMVPVSEEEVRHLIDVAYSLEWDPDDNTRQLIQSLMKSAPEFSGITNERVAEQFVKFLYALSRNVLGDRLADQLGYPASRYRLRSWALIRLTWIFERFPALVPSRVRAVFGVQFWLEHSSFDMSNYAGIDHNHPTG